MNPLHTPIKIDFLLSIYCGSFRRNNFPQHTSPISETVLQGLVDEKLVMFAGESRGYILTVQGMEFVERLLNTPLEPTGAKAQRPYDDILEIKPSSKPVLSSRTTFDDFYGSLKDASKTVGRVFELHLLKAVRLLGWIVEEHIAKEQKS